MRPLIIGFRHRANTVGTDYMDSGSQNKQFGHFYLLIQSVDLGSRFLLQEIVLDELSSPLFL